MGYSAIGKGSDKGIAKADAATAVLRLIEKAKKNADAAKKQPDKNTKKTPPVSKKSGGAQKPKKQTAPAKAKPQSGKKGGATKK